MGEPTESGGVNAALPHMPPVSRRAELEFVARLSRLELLLLRLSVLTECASLDCASEETSSFVDEFCVNVVAFRFSLFSMRRYSLATKSNLNEMKTFNLLKQFFYRGIEE